MILRAGLSGNGSLGGVEGEGEGVKMDEAHISRRVHNGRWTNLRLPYPALYHTSILGYTPSPVGESHATSATHHMLLLE